MIPSACIPSLLYQSPLLAPYSERLIHGFTGKPLSLGGPDTPDNPRSRVLANRQQLAQVLGIAAEAWAIPDQVHGHRVGRTGDARFLKTDAIVLTGPMQPVMLLFADCVPMMLYDPERHAGAVIHAGWRGTAQAVVQEAAVTLQNITGTPFDRIQAVIGPAIHGCCFQVSLDVAQTLAQMMDWTLEQAEAEGCLFWDEGYPQNPRVDLKAINRIQLNRLGIQAIDTAPECTRCQESTLFSFRRGENGRNSAFMMLYP